MQQKPASVAMVTDLKTFNKSLMVSTAVSKLGCSGLVFVDPGTKINGRLYHDELLLKRLLPAIR